MTDDAPREENAYLQAIHHPDRAEQLEALGSFLQQETEKAAAQMEETDAGAEDYHKGRLDAYRTVLSLVLQANLALRGTEDAPPERWSADDEAEDSHLASQLYPLLQVPAVQRGERYCRPLLRVREAPQLRQHTPRQAREAVRQGRSGRAPGGPSMSRLRLALENIFDAAEGT